MVMRDMSPSLWPFRSRLLPDELLTSWIIHLAHGLGLKVQTFCQAVYGRNLQVWNRDIDRFGPDWVIGALVAHTGIAQAAVIESTLRSYEGKIYSNFKSSGALMWILTLKMHHRKRDGFGMQFCGKCLAEDKVPYFRKRWRVAYCTICTKHQTLLYDRCPACCSAIAFHRTDVGRGPGVKSNSLAVCHVCGFNLARAPSLEIPSLDDEVSILHEQMCADLEDLSSLTEMILDLDELRVLHHLTALLLSVRKIAKLRLYLCARLGIEDQIRDRARVGIEGRPLHERHFLVQLAAWLFLRLEERMRQAWMDDAILNNQMYRDFPDPPVFYLKVVSQFTDARRRKAADLMHGPDGRFEKRRKRVISGETVLAASKAAIR